MQDNTASEATAATTTLAEAAPAVQAFATTAAVAAGCQIYPPTTFQVCGAIRDKYNQMGGPTSFLLFPKSNELTNPGNTGKRSEFIGGNIYWSASTGAHPVAHEFLFKWGDHGYETGFLKYPKTDEIVLSDGISRRQEFQGGHIYWSPATGAHSIQGLIYNKWKALGAETGVLKFPTSDEIVAPDGKGRFTTFQGGAIYWHPNTGAHPVYGPLHMFWGMSGYEAGPYGYPTAGPVYTGDNVSQTFQRGTLRLWDGQLGGVHQVDDSEELTLDDTWIFPEYPVWPKADTFADWNTVDDPDGSLSEQNRQEANMVDNALATLGGYDVTRYLWRHMYEDPGLAVTLAPSTVDEWMEESFTGIPEFTAPALVRAANRDHTVATAIEFADRLEGVQREVGPERDPAIGLDPLAGEPDHLSHGGLEVVVADLPGRHPSENLEGVHVALEERLLPTGRRCPVDSLARVGHPQREQMTGHQVAAEPHRELAEVDLAFAARQVGLRHEHVRLATAVLDPDLPAPVRDVGPHGVVGDSGHVVLGDEPVEDPGRGVALLARCVQVGHQHLLDHRLERVELGAAVGVGGSGARPGRFGGGFDRAPSDVAGALDLASRCAGTKVAADAGVQLDLAGTARRPGHDGRYSAPAGGRWQTASRLMPSGSATNAP